MGNPFSIPCDPCVNKVFHWLDYKVAHIRHLKKNLAALEKAIGELKAKREDLLRKVTREEDRGQQRLAEFQVWFTNAEDIEKETDDLLRNRDVELQRLCLCGFCSKSLRSSYCYGKNVILTLREVEKKLKSPVFEVVAELPQTSEVQEIQPPRIIVGQDKRLYEALGRLFQDDVGILGMYGMGGVGKTMLLTLLNHEISGERCGFDFVIWVVVSKELNSEKIQDEIAQKVGLGGEEWKKKEKSEKVTVIYNFLRKKRFMLFLDDIREKVDLTEIGVPFPTTENKSKVAFTTRSQDVCTQMGVKDSMEVKCLPDNDAFRLFDSIRRRRLESDPEIDHFSRIVAQKCCGLPLALIIIGKTMSYKRTIYEWHHAIAVFNRYNNEHKILGLLKYSYDHLNGMEVKSCLLYCALFPEGYKIPKKGLIEYWISEGIIDGREGIERAENKGYEIIGNLVRASLLMEAVDAEKIDCVYMHDVVREMALWIASDLEKQKEAFIVCAGIGLREMPKVENWSIVRRMSLMGNKICHLVGSPECLQLTTLLLRHMELENISSEFFKFMHALSVLDLSENQGLSELPDAISELLSLQYLNLSGTCIRHLPMVGKGLKKLIYLNLRETSRLSSLAGISRLINLKFLELYGSSFSWDIKIVEELETLEHLEVLTLGIQNDSLSLERYLNSHKLASCTRVLAIEHIDLGSSRGISLLVTMEKLRELRICYCRISEIKMVYNPTNSCFLSLSKVVIYQCKFLKELTFLMFALNLKHLCVEDASQLEDIINKEKACEGEKSWFVPFRKLISLWLNELPELKSIYWRPLPFPCLKEICVERCPNLKKLPLDAQSCMTGKNGVVIAYKPSEWIEGVEWEDEATKTRFLSSCQKDYQSDYSS